jgi:hypothetical protein
VGDVAEDFDRAQCLVVLSHNGHYPNADREPVTVFTPHEHVGLAANAALHALAEWTIALAEAAPRLVHVAEQVIATMLSDDFGRTESAQRLGSVVPVQDATAGIDEIHGIVQVIQQQFVKVGVIVQELPGLG